MTRRKKQNKKSAKFFIKLILTATVLIILIYFTDLFLNAPIKASAEYKSKQIASEILNSAVTNAIENCGYTYNDLTVIRRNSDDNVVSIEANTVNLAKLQSAATENIINELKSVNHMTAEIPLGALLGSSMLSGMGPDITIEFTFGGYVTSKTVSKFTSAGINQTNHTIIITNEIEIISIIAGKRFSTLVPNEFIAAQTVIVGDIPDYFTQIITRDKELVNSLALDSDNRQK